MSSNWKCLHTFCLVFTTDSRLFGGLINECCARLCVWHNSSNFSSLLITIKISIPATETRLVFIVTVLQVNHLLYSRIVDLIFLTWLLCFSLNKSLIWSCFSNSELFAVGPQASWIKLRAQSTQNTKSCFIKNLWYTVYLTGTAVVKGCRDDLSFCFGESEELC